MEPLPPTSELTPPVECADRVSFRHRRGVEHRVPEALQSSPESEHRLAHVDHLRGSLAHDTDDSNVLRNVQELTQRIGVEGAPAVPGDRGRMGGSGSAGNRNVVCKVTLLGGALDR